MEISCRAIQGMLVDYSDGQLSPADSSQIVEHLATCDKCRKLLDALQRSIELAGAIWTDGLSKTENLRIATSRGTGRIRWFHYVAAAASIVLVTTVSVVWRTSVKPKDVEVTFAQIEREVTDSASAARLLAATELLAEYPDARPIVDQQYRYIVETYPQTSAATKAQSRLQ